MRNLLALLALTVSSNALAQTIPPATQFPPPASAFPSPAVGELGPVEALPDGLTFNDHIGGTGSTHTVGESEDGSGTSPRGAFRFDCMAGQVLADDPVVYPGKPGRSHPHQFYGNGSVNAYSTYASIRAAGESTCQNDLNRSGYWVPALIVWDEAKKEFVVQRPESIKIYYKREPEGSPQCTPGDPKFIGICVNIPNGIVFIAGVDMVTNTLTNGQILFKCVAPNDANRGTFSGDLVTTAATCQNGDILDVFAESSPCWNGQLDSPNHRSHLAEFITKANGNPGCPSTHPYYIPFFTIQSNYRVTASLNKSGAWAPGQKTWYASSDFMPGMEAMRPFSTYHFDYREGWNPRAKKAWYDNCINKRLTCVAGDLGNGYALKQEYPLTNDAGNPGSRFVNVPANIFGPFKKVRVKAPQ